MKPADMTPSHIAQIAMTAERATRTYAHTCTPTRMLRATLIPESSALALHTKQYSTLPQLRVGAQKQENRRKRLQSQCLFWNRLQEVKQKKQPTFPRCVCQVWLRVTLCQNRHLTTYLNGTELCGQMLSYFSNSPLCQLSNTGVHFPSCFQWKQ